MKIKNVLSLLLILMGSISYGQIKLTNDFDVSLGKPYPVVDAKSKEYFSDGAGNVIMVKMSSKKVNIQRYDSKTMTQISTKLYTDFPEKCDLQSIVQVKGKLYYMYSVKNKDKKSSFFSREIGYNTGEFSKANELFTTEGEVSKVWKSNPTSSARYGSFYGFGAQSKFDVQVSFDDSKILIQYRNVPLEKSDAKNYDVIGFQVFDASLKKVWGKEVKMPYTEKQMNNMSYEIGSDGTAYLLSYLNETKTYEWISINKSGDVKTNKMTLDGTKLFEGIIVIELPNGTFSCSGYYFNGIEYVFVFGAGMDAITNINGLMYFNIDKNGKTLSQNFYEFPLELINQNESKNASAKNAKREDVGKAGIKNLQLREVLVQADGSTVFVGEQYHMIVVSNGQNSSTYKYFYDDMVVSKVDKNGKLLWMKKFTKSQLGINTTYGLGVKYIYQDGAHYLLYLDNVKNINLAATAVPKQHLAGKGGFLTAYKINDANGEFEKHNFFNLKDIKGQKAFQFNLDRIVEASNNEFLVEIYIKGKLDNMVKIEAKK